MTDWFGRWDAVFVLLLLVGLCMAGLRWKRQQRRRACLKPTERTRFQQMSDLCVDPPKLRARYEKPDARWTSAGEGESQ